MQDLMNIVHLGPTRVKGGVAVAIRQAAISLAKLGHTVTVIGDGGPEAQKIVDSKVANYIELSWTSTAVGSIKLAWKLRAILQRLKPDIVHVHGRGPSLTCHLAGRVPDFFTLHSSHLTHQRGVFDFGLVRKLASPMARHVFTLDENGRQNAIVQLGRRPDRVSVLPHGIDTREFSPVDDASRQAIRATLGLTPTTTAVIYVGRLHAIKGPMHVIALADAMSRDASLTDVTFMVVGTGPLEPEMRREIDRRGLQSKIRMLGWCDDPRKFYHAADLVVMPSQQEGFGLVAAEAASCGAAILRTNTGGASVTVNPSVTGYICEIDEKSFVDAGLSALRERHRLPQMRVAARHWALQKLDINRQIDALLNAYQLANS